MQHYTAFRCWRKKTSDNWNCLLALVVSVTENRSTDTKPNNKKKKHKKIPKPNDLNNMREIPIFYRIHSHLHISWIGNTNRVPKTLRLKYQIPSWYRFGIGIPKRWYPIDLFSAYVKHSTLNSAIEQELRDRRVEDSVNATSSALRRLCPGGQGWTKAEQLISSSVYLYRWWAWIFQGVA